MAKKTTTKADNKKSDATDRETELEKALQKITKAFGEGAVMKMGDRPELKIDVVSTGILSLDLALGVGGLPRGRIVEIYGPESSGKTTIALQTIAELQKTGGKAAYIDAENAMDPKYAAELGVNIDDLLLSQPNSGEQGLEIAEMLIESAAVDVVVIDSVAALVPKAEIEGAIGDSHVGLQARLMSQALRKMAGTINNTNTLVIFINQLREKVGIVFGNPEVTPGGRALKFYASVRIEVRKGQQVKDGKNVVGFASKLKVTKNKVAPPFKTVETTMSFGHGIEHNTDMINLATDKTTIWTLSLSPAHGTTMVRNASAKAWSMPLIIWMSILKYPRKSKPRSASSPHRSQKKRTKRRILLKTRKQRLTRSLKRNQQLTKSRMIRKMIHPASGLTV